MTKSAYYSYNKIVGEIIFDLYIIIIMSFER